MVDQKEKELLSEQTMKTKLAAGFQLLVRQTPINHMSCKAPPTIPMNVSNKLPPGMSHLLIRTNQTKHCHQK